MTGQELNEDGVRQGDLSVVYWCRWRLCFHLAGHPRHDDCRLQMALESEDKIERLLHFLA